MNLICDKARWFEDGDGFWLAFRTKDRKLAVSISESVKDAPWTVEANPQRKRRSLDANAYCWVLIGKLAAKVGASPEDVYRQFIPDVADNYVIQPVREDMLKRWDTVWCGRHVGRLTDDMGPCRRTEGYHNVRCFFGSSDYDSTQMARLIDLIVADCKEQGIETMTPEELASLVDRWGNG